MKTEYTALEIGEDILNIRRSRIQLYIDKGVICPFDESRAKGSKHRFSPDNIVEIALAMYITGIGLSMDVARHTLSVMRVEFPEYLKPFAKISGGSVNIAMEFKNKSDQQPEIWIKKRVKGAGVDYKTDTDDNRHVVLINLTAIKNEVEARL